ncbi:hypothetical protein [Holospora curviuscula]|uniref:Uncharacterized protein n=1 Tax=Holospora curviuscula TaxID=1082868 RepID=A0A2S5R8I3_9PROT|nr:hypothetical protein [Holospora curviuscula]PPE03445.1 hypothetical protein HCUR_01100 [Holospora curviuscula]
MFEVPRNTVSRWRKQYKKEGKYDARERLKCNRRLDYAKGRIFVKNHEKDKLKEIRIECAINKRYAAVILNLFLWRRRGGKVRWISRSHKRYSQTKFCIVLMKVMLIWRVTKRRDKAEKREELLCKRRDNYYKKL